MRDIAKIGIIAGAAGIGIAAVHCIKQKSFMRGFDAGVMASLKTADEEIDEMEKKYSKLADDYNNLYSDYCQMLDNIG